MSQGSLKEKVLAKYKVLSTEDYKGEHQAPGKGGDDAPMYDLKGIYPDDIYSGEAVKLYSAGESYDSSAISIIQAARGKPNSAVKIFRAVPERLSTEEQIARLEDFKRYMLKIGKIPPKADTKLTDKSKYYDLISDEVDKLKALPASDPVKKLSINKGDWVTIVRQYALDHGKSSLNGKYQILTKTVKAKDLYTEGNSIHEWGYDP